MLIAAAPEHALLVEPGTSAADSYGQKIERRYATVEVKRRLHQDAFRFLVLEAYSERCAICNLPRRELLDAAHIVADRDPRGEPSVPNGLSLCKLHHSAFDANLIGIRPDRIVEVSRILLDETDGPTLEVALKGVDGHSLHLPRHAAQHPNRDFLDMRYQRFRASA